MTISINEIKKMSVSEKIKLAEEIWQDIPNDSPEIMISEADKIELDKRLEKIESGNYKTLSWQEIKYELEDIRKNFMKIEFLYEARLDMIQAHNWYETKNKNLGKVFELSIEKSLNEISLLPKASPIWYKSIRRYVVDKFPYGLFYLLKNEIIIIVAVFAFKQNPKYLVDRINNNI